MIIFKLINKINKKKTIFNKMKMKIVACQNTKIISIK